VTLYLIDANILITAHNGYYSTNRVPEFWSWLLHQAEAGRVKMPLEMMDEVKEGTGDAEKDLLHAWLQGGGVKATLQLEEDVDPTRVQNILDVGYGQHLTDVELEAIGGDPFLMAYALASPHDRCVVSNEISKPKAQRANRKVPDICGQFGLTNCDAVGLIRKLDFKTAWATA